MRKIPGTHPFFLSVFGKNIRLGAALALGFSLFAPGGDAQESRGSVVSVSPSGQSSLSWKRPSNELAPISFGGSHAGLPITPSPTPETPRLVLPSSETVAWITPEPTATPIRPVQLLEISPPEVSAPTPPTALPILPAFTVERPVLEQPVIEQPMVERGMVERPMVVASTATPPILSATPTPSATPVLSATPARDFGGPIEGDFDECPDPKTLSSIRDLSYKVTLEAGLFPASCPLPDEVYSRTAPTPIVFNWKASALCHKPAYFEDVQLERYGHTICPLAQPFISGARFWLTIPILPYLMGTYPPNECIYDLGYYRPGSCAPHMLEPLPISLRGALWQAGATVGFAYIIP